MKSLWNLQVQQEHELLFKGCLRLSEGRPSVDEARHKAPKADHDGIEPTDAQLQYAARPPREAQKPTRPL